MADGKGCKCAAYDQSECACDADWTPQELIDARAEIERLRLTDAEREATLKLRKWAREIAGDNAFIDEVRDAADDAARAMDSLLERHE